MAKLNPKQQLFVTEYLKDLNATQAAIRAGYSKKTAGSQAHDLLKIPEIEAAVNDEIDKRVQRTQINGDYVLIGIKNLIERCIQAEPVLDKDGEPTGEYKFEAYAALKGYELLGKHLKLFTDSAQAEINSREIDFGKLPMPAGESRGAGKPN
jgi:phage terminase small subunit